MATKSNSYHTSGKVFPVIVRGKIVGYANLVQKHRDGTPLTEEEFAANEAALLKSIEQESYAINEYDRRA